MFSKTILQAQNFGGAVHHINMPAVAPPEAVQAPRQEAKPAPEVSPLGPAFSAVLRFLAEVRDEFPEARGLLDRAVRLQAEVERLRGQANTKLVEGLGEREERAKADCRKQNEVLEAAMRDYHGAVQSLNTTRQQVSKARLAYTTAKGALTDHHPWASASEIEALRKAADRAQQVLKTALEEDSAALAELNAAAATTSSERGKLQRLDAERQRINAERQGKSWFDGALGLERRAKRY